MLVRLLYCSRAVDASEGAIDAILSSARHHNVDSGITGILCYGDGVFLQCIEGGRMQVNELYATIQKDPRHKEVVLLAYEEICERRFAGWSLGQVNVSKLNQTTLLKYSAKPHLDPYAVSGQASLSLLEDLAATAAICGRS
jgi:hypothetical protein